jgi:hypothetical protein
LRSCQRRGSSEHRPNVSQPGFDLAWADVANAFASLKPALCSSAAKRDCMRHSLGYRTRIDSVGLARGIHRFWPWLANSRDELQLAKGCSKIVRPGA